jgi:hypothetical protein
VVENASGVNLPLWLPSTQESIINCYSLDVLIMLGYLPKARFWDDTLLVLRPGVELTITGCTEGLPPDKDTGMD